MAQYVGELRLMSFNFPPKGWAFCDGRLLPINVNTPLFSLLGTMYGGNGTSNFALPDLRGRTPLHVGGGFTQGEVFGEESHVLAIGELPTHVHQVQATTANANQPIPSILASANNLYAAPTDLTSIHPQTVAVRGSSSPHENRQPYAVLSWCIALTGIFPSRN